MSAQEPSFGTLIGRTDGDILEYSCSVISFNRISCDFTQVLLSQNETELDWLQTLELLENEATTDEARTVFCEGEMGAAIEYLSDGMPDDLTKYGADISEFVSLAKQEPVYFQKMGELGSNYCATNNLEDLKLLLRHSHDRSAVTCSPFVNSYSQEYVKTDDTQWVVDSSPSGSCGVINTSYFYQNRSDGYLWSHVAQKVITNKTPNSGLIACADLDETPIHYEWNGPAVFLGCTYIE